MGTVCTVCCHHCNLAEGQTGLCHARRCEGGKSICINYGAITGAALDPIEKKPLARFMPGSRILSVGSFGCNLRCPFCQNWEISLAGMKSGTHLPASRPISPEELCDFAQSLRDRGNIGVAYTYNEPLIGWEYVRDAAKLVHESGMVNVLVSNGTAELSVLDEILPYVDAMNIDLKSFSKEIYRKELGGDRDMVLRFIERAARNCHMEITTLIVPGMNDSEQEMREISGWIAAHVGRDTAFHVSRYFPRHNCRRPPTDVRLVYRLADIAREKLRFVYTGNC